jgi:uncharacterized protein (DUF1697 family)
MTYIALLRGVNVGGVVVKMEPLREVFEKLGFKNVRSYVQSGNLLFEAGKASPDSLAAKIRGAVKAAFGREFPVMVLEGAQLKSVAAKNPFAKGADPKSLYVSFLSGKPSKEGLERFAARKAAADDWRVVGQAVYLRIPAGYGKTKLDNNSLERCTGLEATTRNWNTVQTLIEMAQSA